MSYLLNLIRSAPIEFFYLDIDSDEMKKTTINEYKNLPNKDKIYAFNFFNITLDFEFEIELFPNIQSLLFDTIIFTSLSSYSFISKCKKLSKLELKKCYIKYLSSLLSTSNIQLKTLKLDLRKLKERGSSFGVNTLYIPRKPRSKGIKDLPYDLKIKTKQIKL